MSSSFLWMLETFVDGQPSPLYSKPKRVTRLSKTKHKEGEECALSSDGYTPLVSKLPLSSSSSSTSQQNMYVMDSFGQDSFLFSTHPNCSFVGVADGVGGWRDEGVDSQEMSQLALKRCSEFFLNKKYKRKFKNLSHMVEHVYTDMFQSHAEKILGGTTLCLAYLYPHRGYLELFNLGDSGLVILREGCVVYACRGSILQGELPQLSIANQMSKKTIEEQVESDLEFAQTDILKVQEHDWILLASDGLWDNLECQPAKGIVKEIQSIYQSMEEKQLSPFLMALKKRTCTLMQGTHGKFDDLTLVGSNVCKKYTS